MVATEGRPSDQAEPFLAALAATATEAPSSVAVRVREEAPWEVAAGVLAEVEAGLVVAADLAVVIQAVAAGSIHIKFSGPKDTCWQVSFPSVVFRDS